MKFREIRAFSFAVFFFCRIWIVLWELGIAGFDLIGGNWGRIFQ